MDPLKVAANKVFLALVLWREARGEAHQTKIAVANTIMTRVKNPGWWGKDVLSVLFKKWQYSSMTDPHDAQLSRWPDGADATFWECMQIANDAVEGTLPDYAPGADSYYDTSIPPPSWATKENLIAQLGRIRFHAVNTQTKK